MLRNVFIKIGQAISIKTYASQRFYKNCYFILLQYNLNNIIMSFQYSIEDIKQTKVNDLVQKPIIISLLILLLTPMFTYAIFHISIILRSVVLIDNNFRLIKFSTVFMIGFITIYTAIKIAINIAITCYNMTKTLYIMLNDNNFHMFDNIFYVLFLLHYSLLFTIVLLIPVDISLFITIIYIIIY